MFGMRRYHVMRDSFVIVNADDNIVTQQNFHKPHIFKFMAMMRSEYVFHSLFSFYRILCKILILSGIVIL